MTGNKRCLSLVVNDKYRRRALSHPAGAVPLVHEYVLSRVYELDALLVLNLINTTRGHHHHCGHGKTLASTYQGEEAPFGRDWLVVREGTLGGQNMLRLLMGRGGDEG
jgi:hypothetical protein